MKKDAEAFLRRTGNGRPWYWQAPKAQPHNEFVAGWFVAFALATAALLVALVLSREALEHLADYSFSQPTGVYPGKMWRATEWSDLPWCGGKKTGKYFLHWFGEHPDPNFCSNHCREIIVV